MATCLFDTQSYIFWYKVGLVSNMSNQICQFYRDEPNFLGYTEFKAIKSTLKKDNCYDKLCRPGLEFFEALGVFENGASFMLIY